MKLKDGLAILITDFNKAPFKDYDVPKTIITNRP